MGTAASRTQPRADGATGSGQEQVVAGALVPSAGVGTKQHEPERTAETESIEDAAAAAAAASTSYHPLIGSRVDEVVEVLPDGQHSQREVLHVNNDNAVNQEQRRTTTFPPPPQQQQQGQKRPNNDHKRGPRKKKKKKQQRRQRRKQQMILDVHVWDPATQTVVEVEHNNPNDDEDDVLSKGSNSSNDSGDEDEDDAVAWTGQSEEEHEYVGDDDDDNAKKHPRHKEDEEEDSSASSSDPALSNLLGDFQCTLHTKPLILALDTALKLHPNTKEPEQQQQQQSSSWSLSLQQQQQHPLIPAGSGCLLHIVLSRSCASDLEDAACASSGFWNSTALQTQLLRLPALQQQHVANVWDAPVDTLAEIAKAIQVCQQQETAWQNDHEENTKDDDKKNDDKSTGPSSFYEQFYGATEDMLWWQHKHGALPLKDLAKLRRVLLPVTLLITILKEDEDASTTMIMPHHSLQQLDWSLADLWTAERGSSRNTLLRLLLRTLQHMKRVIQTTKTQSQPETAVQYREIQRLMTDCCQSVGGSFLLGDVSVTLDQSFSLHKLPLQPSHTMTQTRRSYSATRGREWLELGLRRQKLTREYEQQQNKQQRRKGTQALLSPSKQVFSLQADGMTEEEFLAETSLMHRVNASFPSCQWESWRSRPKFARILVSTEASDTLASSLQRVFFTSDGCLSASCRRDASRTFRNHFLTFDNGNRDTGKETAADWRWQLPLPGPLTATLTRQKVQDVLFDAQVLDPSHERVTDICLVVGGTRDQSLHHDVRRVWTSWRKGRTNSNNEVSSLSNDLAAEAIEEETVGWEYNRLQYNAIMASPHAPSTLLVPMGGVGHASQEREQELPCVHIGVQRDQIVKCTERPGRCHIRHGDPCQDFEIVRETPHLVVLKVPGGCMFTGDFPHAGVSCVTDDNPNDGARLQQLCHDIDQLLTEHAEVGLSADEQEQQQEQKSRVDGIDRILEHCGRFRGLNRLCRLQVSTEPIDCAFQVPLNSVGYYKCYSNGS